MNYDYEGEQAKFSKSFHDKLNKHNEISSYEREIKNMKSFKEELDQLCEKYKKVSEYNDALLMDASNIKGIVIRSIIALEDNLKKAKA